MLLSRPASQGGSCHVLRALRSLHSSACCQDAKTDSGSSSRPSPKSPFRSAAAKAQTASAGAKPPPPQRWIPPSISRESSRSPWPARPTPPPSSSPTRTKKPTQPTPNPTPARKPNITPSLDDPASALRQRVLNVRNKRAEQVQIHSPISSNGSTIEPGARFTAHAEILPSWRWQPAKPIPPSILSRFWGEFKGIGTKLIGKKQEPTAQDEMIQEERVIFERPFGRSTKHAWLFGIAAVSLAVTWFILPDNTEEVKAEHIDQAKRQGGYGFFYEKILANSKTTFSAVVVGVWAFWFALMFMQSRNISRLSWIRRRRLGSSDTNEWKNTIRIQHSGQEMFSNIRPREVEPELVSVRLINSASRNDFINLDINLPNQSRLMKAWNSKYRLNFGNTEALEEKRQDDLVIILSINRLEHVFGVLQTPDFENRQPGIFGRAWNSRVMRSFGRGLIKTGGALERVYLAVSGAFNRTGERIQLLFGQKKK